MVDILKALPAAAASTQAARRGDVSRGGEFNSAETPTGAPTSFADVLKSLGGKATARAGKTLAEELALPTAAAAAASSTADPAAVPASLFPLPVPDAPLVAEAEPAPVATAIAAAADPEAEALPALPEAPQLQPTALPLAAAANVPPAPPASADETARAVASAPTLSAPGLPVADARDSRKGQQQANRGVAIPAAENARHPDKLAVDAANTAESGKAGTHSASLEHESGEFRAVIERVANNPAAVNLQASEARTSTARIQDLPVATQLGRAGWQDEVGQKLTWMAGTNRQQADLVLNPPQLGRIEVTMRFEGDQLSASFTSPHAVVRETLENSMVRLREVLADAGITLAHTHVGAESRHDSKSMHPGQGQQPADRGNARLATLPDAEMEIASAWRSSDGRGMVDLFA